MCRCTAARGPTITSTSLFACEYWPTPYVCVRSTILRCSRRSSCCRRGRLARTVVLEPRLVRGRPRAARAALAAHDREDVVVARRRRHRADRARAPRVPPLLEHRVVRLIARRELELALAALERLPGRRLLLVVLGVGERDGARRRARTPPRKVPRDDEPADDEARDSGTRSECDGLGTLGIDHGRDVCRRPLHTRAYEGRQRRADAPRFGHGPLFTRGAGPIRVGLFVLLELLTELYLNSLRFVRDALGA